MHCARSDIEESDAVRGRGTSLSRAWQARPARNRARPCTRRGAGIARLDGQQDGPGRGTATLPYAAAQAERAPPVLKGLLCLPATRGAFRLGREAVHDRRLGWLTEEHALPSTAAALPRMARRRIAPAVAAA